MKKYLIHIMFMIAASACLASCVYPFNPEMPDGQTGIVVIEGDILIGEVSPVMVTYSGSLAKFGSIPKNIDAQVWVEDSRGAVYNSGLVDEEGVHYVDMTDADPSLEYCLHVINLENSKEYVSRFERCCGTPVIDSLSYIPDEARNKLNIALSMHAKGESYFRWSYVEDWEYHAYYHALLKYIPPETRYVWGQPNHVGNGQIVPFDYPENTYYCWNHDESDQIMIFSTEKQTEDRFVDLEFHQIDRNDRRISYIYHIEVNLEPMTKDAYQYWANIKQNSDYSGSLFAPTPSEMMGNIKCVQDESEQVLGFINVAQRAQSKLYVHNGEAKFYKDPDLHVPETIQPSMNDWYDRYTNGFLPYYTDTPGAYSSAYWSEARCLDCRLLGGNKNRPDWWITKDE